METSYQTENLITYLQTLDKAGVISKVTSDVSSSYLNGVIGLVLSYLNLDSSSYTSDIITFIDICIEFYLLQIHRQYFNVPVFYFVRKYFTLPNTYVDIILSYLINNSIVTSDLSQLTFSYSSSYYTTVTENIGTLSTNVDVTPVISASFVTGWQYNPSFTFTNPNNTDLFASFGSNIYDIPPNSTSTIIDSGLPIIVSESCSLSVTAIVINSSSLIYSSSILTSLNS